MVESEQTKKLLLAQCLDQGLLVRGFYELIAMSSSKGLVEVLFEWGADQVLVVLGFDEVMTEQRLIEVVLEYGMYHVLVVLGFDEVMAEQRLIDVVLEYGVDHVLVVLGFDDVMA